MIHSSGTRRVLGVAVLLAGWGEAALAAPALPPVPEVIALREAPAVVPLNVAPAPVVQGSFRPAPMPDADASAPVAVADGGAVIKPRLYAARSEYHGDGYTGASDDHARSLQPAPGLAVAVPLN